MAGLELCEFIREQQGNRVTQLYLRVGQAGIPPAQDLLDRYDISGCLTKAQATQDKLDSLIKSGVRQAYERSAAVAFDVLLQRLIMVSCSREAMVGELDRFVAALREDASAQGPTALDFQLWTLIDGQPVRSGQVGEEQKLSLVRDQLRASDHRPLNASDDCWYAVGNDYLVAIAPDSTRPAVEVLVRGTRPPVEPIVRLQYGFLREFAMLWQQAS
jgi:hypothetical protein